MEEGTRDNTSVEAWHSSKVASDRIGRNVYQLGRAEDLPKAHAPKSESDQSID